MVPEKVQATMGPRPNPGSSDQYDRCQPIHRCLPAHPCRQVHPLPTPTPKPTHLPAPCNAAYFVKDMTVVDGASLPVNSPFVKIWRLKNVGSCTWTKDYEISFDGGDKLGGKTASMPRTVSPGEIVDIAISMKAPDDQRYLQRLLDPAECKWEQVRLVRMPETCPSLSRSK